MLINAKRQFPILLIGLLCLLCFIGGCKNDAELVSGFGPAQVQINLKFDDETGSLLTKGTPLGKRAVSQVLISVLDATTEDIIVPEQELEISFSQDLGTNVATGVLSIPITGDLQVFDILIFIADVDNLQFGVGATSLNLTPGEIRQADVLVLPAQPNLLTDSGTATASSVYQGAYPPNLAIDGLDFGTSWLSGGSNADGDTSRFTWTSPTPQFMATCGIVNNSNNNEVNFRTGFGFDQVTFRVFSGPNATGNVLREQTLAYPKTAELPFAQFSPLVTGQSIQLLFTGHENPASGGFSELIVVGRPQ